MHKKPLPNFSQHIQLQVNCNCVNGLSLQYKTRSRAAEGYHTTQSHSQALVLVVAVGTFLQNLQKSKPVAKRENFALDPVVHKTAQLTIKNYVICISNDFAYMWKQRAVPQNNILTARFQTSFAKSAILNVSRFRT